MSVSSPQQKRLFGQVMACKLAAFQPVTGKEQLVAEARGQHYQDQPMSTSALIGGGIGALSVPALASIMDPGMFKRDPALMARMAALTGGIGALGGAGSEALGRLLTRSFGPNFRRSQWYRDQDPHRLNSALRVAPLGLAVLGGRMLPSLMQNMREQQIKQTSALWRTGASRSSRSSPAEVNHQATPVVTPNLRTGDWRTKLRTGANFKNPAKAQPAQSPMISTRPLSQLSTVKPQAPLAAVLQSKEAGLGRLLTRFALPAAKGHGGQAVRQMLHSPTWKNVTTKLDQPMQTATSAVRGMANVPAGEKFWSSPFKGVRRTLKLGLNPNLGTWGNRLVTRPAQVLTGLGVATGAGKVYGDVSDLQEQIGGAVNQLEGTPLQVPGKAGEYLKDFSTSLPSWLYKHVWNPDNDPTTAMLNRTAAGAANLYGRHTINNWLDGNYNPQTFSGKLREMLMHMRSPVVRPIERSLGGGAFLDDPYGEAKRRYEAMKSSSFHPFIKQAGTGLIPSRDTMSRVKNVAGNALSLAGSMLGGAATTSASQWPSRYFPSAYTSPIALAEQMTKYWNMTGGPAFGGGTFTPSPAMQGGSLGGLTGALLQNNGIGSLVGAAGAAAQWARNKGWLPALPFGKSSSASFHPFVKAADELQDRLLQAQSKVKNNPSEKEIESGCYSKGHYRVQGLDITIETAAGQTRRGVNKTTGVPWEIKLTAPYGYIKGTDSAEPGDQMDVFVGPNPSSEIVFGVDQNKADGKTFDELKVVLGCTTSAEAKKLYMDNYSPGWKGFRDITPLTMDQFKSFLRHGDVTKPLAGQQFADFHKAARSRDEEEPRKRAPHKMVQSALPVVGGGALGLAGISELLRRGAFTPELQNDMSDFSRKLDLDKTFQPYAHLPQDEQALQSMADYAVQGNKLLNHRFWGLVSPTGIIKTIRSLPGMADKDKWTPASQQHYDAFEQSPVSGMARVLGELSRGNWPRPDGSYIPELPDSSRGALRTSINALAGKNYADGLGGNRSWNFPAISLPDQLNRSDQMVLMRKLGPELKSTLLKQPGGDKVWEQFVANIQTGRDTVYNAYGKLTKGLQHVNNAWGGANTALAGIGAAGLGGYGIWRWLENRRKQKLQQRQRQHT